MNSNKELELAWDFVNQTDRHIFLTGKAGTGKTTFLKRLKKESLKRMVVVAPTGVAAINAKGVTIHSFFQLAFGPILPDGSSNNDTGFKRNFNKTKINIIKSLDLLVIDEISMVRCDVLDGIDQTLRRYRDRGQVFGGVQVLMIGDLQQLSPVVRGNEWSLLNPYYETPFFFSSRAYKECDALTIELQHIYRQDNPTFIQILNEIRTNSLTSVSADELNKRYQPDFQPKEEEGYVSLTTHNHKAKSVNANELKALNGTVYNYEAKIEGKFPEFSYPNESSLELKVGAQVMFVKNDTSADKLYFNGKIGKVIQLDKETITVKCPDDNYTIEVTPETWENINYTLNPETKAISEQKLGSYIQMPLRLAWAITIHKSQGLTFERAIIDSQGAFAHGQTYVALSRCKSLEGLVLRNKIEPNQIINDQHVNTFNKQSEDNQPDEHQLITSRVVYQLGLISELFNYYEFLIPIRRILDIYYKNRSSIKGNLSEVITEIKLEITNLLKVANGFKFQLQQLTESHSLPESDENIQERFKKAISYFDVETEKNITGPFESIVFTTDNKAVQTDLKKHLETFEVQLKLKQLFFKKLINGFKVTQYLALRASGKIEISEQKQKSKPKKVNIVGTSHVDLFERLRVFRNDTAEELDLIHYQIFSQKSLYEMCELLPTTKGQLVKINGFGKVRVKKYGEEILDIITSYCRENDIDVVNGTDDDVYEAESTKKTKQASNLISLDLFTGGKSLEEIAEERGLAVNTIFGHLASFVETGEVKPTDLVSEAHFKELQNLIPKYKFDSLSELKSQLDDKYSYHEIRIVLKEIAQ